MVIQRNGKFAAVMWNGPGHRFYKLTLPGCVWIEVESLDAAFA